MIFEAPNFVQFFDEERESRSDFTFFPSFLDRDHISKQTPDEVYNLVTDIHDANIMTCLFFIHEHWRQQNYNLIEHIFEIAAKQTESIQNKGDQIYNLDFFKSIYLMITNISLSTILDLEMDENGEAGIKVKYPTAHEEDIKKMAKREFDQNLQEIIEYTPALQFYFNHQK